MATILDGIVKKKPIYEDARPALCAIIWGLCRKGDFLPVDETGDSLELDAVIDLNKLTTTRLKIAGSGGVRGILREGGFIDSTETIPDGIVRLQSANDTLAGRLGSLVEDVKLVAESDIQTRAVRTLLESFVGALEAEQQSAIDRREAVKSRDTDWAAVVEATNDAQGWYDDAEEVWNLRLPALTRIDAQLTLAQQSYDWLTEECDTASQTLRGSIDGYEGEWWTHDGGIGSTTPKPPHRRSTTRSGPRGTRSEKKPGRCVRRRVTGASVDPAPERVRIERSAGFRE